MAPPSSAVFTLAFLAWVAATASALNAAQPQQVHLALTGKPQQLAVSWSTQTSAKSCVEYTPVEQMHQTLLRKGGRRSLQAFHDLTERVCGASHNFTEGSPPAAHTQVLHTTVLTGLIPGQEYWYHCGDPELGWSPIFGFTAKRSADQMSQSSPVKIIIYGDMGDVNSQTLADLQKEVQTTQYDALQHIGDFAYDFADDNGEKGDRFMRSIEPVAAYVPYMASPGNHEVAANFSQYKNRFTMPNPGVDNMYYSYDLGPVHIVSYNTEVYYWPELFGVSHMQRQFEWLEADLKAANRRRHEQPWIIAVGHRPMYCVVATGGKCDTEHEVSRTGIPSVCDPANGHLCSSAPDADGVRFPIEELFFKYGVDVAAYGHVHDYERYYPVYNEQVANTSGIGFGAYNGPTATVHVTTGASGNWEMPLGSDPPPRGKCSDTAPWCAFQSGYNPLGHQASDFSYSRVTVPNATHLHWSQWSSTSQRVIDEFWVVQPRHGSFRAGDLQHVTEL